MTATDFLKSKGYNTYNDGELKETLFTVDVIDDMIEFTRLHVEQALKEASEKAETCLDSAYNTIIDRDTIINAYPLSNIK